jgi:arylsulfotransferase ASST
MPSVRSVPSWLAMFAIMSCADDAPLTGAPRPPVVSRVAIEEIPESTLSLLVSLTASNADSARVRYWTGDDAPEATPFHALSGAGDTKMAVIGLRASKTYSLIVEAIGRGGRTISDPQVTTVGELPLAIRSMRLVGTGRASTGFNLVVPILPDTTMSDEGFVLAFNDAGEICWYHRFPGAWPVEAKQQPNGHITVFVGRSYGWQPNAGAFVELTPAGDVVRTLAVAGGYYTDPHELLLTFRDTIVAAAHLLGYELRDYDLTAIGGSARTSLAVHTIERHDVTGAVTFRWSAAGTFTPADWPLPNPHAVDLVHPSSLAIAPDGGYVVSFQGMDEITKIDSTSGAILWRLGGRHNQYQIRDDPLGGFLGQHDVQVLENGHLLMLDDHFRGVPAPARAVEYSLDAQNMVARLVWQYQPADAVISPIMGSVQRLPNGATLVGFGAAGRIDEVASDGRMIWSATLRSDAASSIPFYRAVRIGSLYEYQKLK